MKHLILVTVILLTLNYFKTIVAQQIDEGFEIEGHGTICRSLVGHCRNPNIPCDEGHEESQSGSPYCTNKHRRCCYPPQEGISGNSTYHKAMRNALPTCSTKGKCGIKGGFCIPNNTICNGNTIIEKGYCSGKGSLHCKCCFMPTVYMRDIENTIAYALRNRVIYKRYNALNPAENEYRQLNRSALVAVSNFAQVLMKHLPLRRKLRKFLKHLDKHLNTEINGHNTIPSNDLKDKYPSLPGHLPNVREWIACRNVDKIKEYRIERFRSYPCGVWTTFHAITVELFNKPEDAWRILQTLHGMVDFFPWCPDCRAHFKAMYTHLNGGDMITPETVTMWLWRAHNKVSVRVQDGFDKYNVTWEPGTSNCKDYKPDLRFQTLLSACKFECKIRKKEMDDCKYIEVSSDDNATTCQICRAHPSEPKPEIPISYRYSLNTATENPGRRKSIFPDIKLCGNCWELVEDYNNPGDFTTKTKETAVLNYLKEIYKKEAIIH